MTSVVAVGRDLTLLTYTAHAVVIGDETVAFLNTQSATLHVTELMSLNRLVRSTSASVLNIAVTRLILKSVSVCDDMLKKRTTRRCTDISRYCLADVCLFSS